MLFFIKPFISAGPVVFGQSRSEVRGACGPYLELRKTPDSGTSADRFDDGFTVYYDADDKAQAVEFGRMCSPVYDKFNIFMLTPGQLSELLADPARTVDADGMAFPSTGIEVSVNDDGDEIESVFVHSRDY